MARDSMAVPSARPRLSLERRTPPGRHFQGPPGRLCAAAQVRRASHHPEGLGSIEGRHGSNPLDQADQAQDIPRSPDVDPLGLWSLTNAHLVPRGDMEDADICQVRRGGRLANQGGDLVPLPRKQSDDPPADESRWRR